MKYIIAWPRFILVILSIFIFFSGYMISSLFLGKTIHRAFRMRQNCVKVILWILGFKIKTHGPIQSITPALYIANHRCFSDPLLALKFFYFYPIGKAEIQNYPLIGKAAAETGILFVQRDDKNSRNGVKEGIRKTLVDGMSIFLCPEGTTNVGQLTKEMKKGSFEIAAELKVPVVVMAMVYHDPETDFWIPGDSLIKHFIKQFGKWRTYVDVYFADQPFINANPILLMNDCKSWIDEKLKLIPVPDEVSRLQIYNLKV